MKIFLIPVLAALIAMAGCQSAPHSTLYQDLGELPGIEKIVDDFLFGLGSDSRIAHHFAEADPERLRSNWSSSSAPNPVAAAPILAIP